MDDKYFNDLETELEMIFKGVIERYDLDEDSKINLLDYSQSKDSFKVTLAVTGGIFNIICGDKDVLNIPFSTFYSKYLNIIVQALPDSYEDENIHGIRLVIRNGNNTEEEENFYKEVYCRDVHSEEVNDRRKKHRPQYKDIGTKALKLLLKNSDFVLMLVVPLIAKKALKFRNK